MFEKDIRSKNLLGKKNNKPFWVSCCNKSQAEVEIYFILSFVNHLEELRACTLKSGLVSLVNTEI